MGTKKVETIVPVDEGERKRRRICEKNDRIEMCDIHPFEPPPKNRHSKLTN